MVKRRPKWKMILLVERGLTKFMGMVMRRNEGRKGPPQWNNTSWWVTYEGYWMEWGTSGSLALRPRGYICSRRVWNERPQWK
ncbi:MAG: hypothetical protein ACTS5A_02740 [Candidatus Hodgkinia cicadicola]